MQDNKQKATIVATFNFTGVELRLSDKGAVIIYKTQDGRAPLFSHCLSPSAVRVHAELGCPVMQALITSPEWEQVNANKQLAKEREKIARQQDALQVKAAKTIQSAFDQLRALGLDPEQVFKKQA
jgi:hypothetical protein